jgi:hypothetical protein
MTATREISSIRFREVRTTTESVFVAHTKGIDERVEANHSYSMTLLKENRLEALTLQKALVLIDKNPKLKEQLKGKCFHLVAEGAEVAGYFTFNEKGERSEGAGDPEKTVHVVMNGKSPFSLHIHSDDLFAKVNWRYYLIPDYILSVHASVVVGLRSSQTEAKVTETATADSTDMLQQYQRELEDLGGEGIRREEMAALMRLEREG